MFVVQTVMQIISDREAIVQQSPPIKAQMRLPIAKMLLMSTSAFTFLQHGIIHQITFKIIAIYDLYLLIMRFACYFTVAS